MLEKEHVENKNYTPRVRELEKTDKRRKVVVAPASIGNTEGSASQCIRNHEELECKTRSHWLQKIAATETSLLVRNQVGETYAKGGSREKKSA